MTNYVPPKIEEPKTVSLAPIEDNLWILLVLILGAMILSSLTITAWMKDYMCEHSGIGCLSHNDEAIEEYCFHEQYRNYTQCATNQTWRLKQGFWT